MSDDGFDASYRPSVRADLEHVVLDGELVVFDPITATVHQLDPIAALLWQFLDGTVTLADLAADVVAAFETSPDQARSGLSSLLDDLGARHLLADRTVPESRTPPERGAYLADPPAP